MIDHELAAVARFEFDRRARKYPALVASGVKSAQDATVDFQAWAAIAAWLERGQLPTLDDGGIDRKTWIGWAECEAAAAEAVAATAKAINDPETAPEKRPRLHQRLAALDTIHRQLGQHRRAVDWLNREFRALRAPHQDKAA